MGIMNKKEIIVVNTAGIIFNNEYSKNFINLILDYYKDEDVEKFVFIHVHHEKIEQEEVKNMLREQGLYREGIDLLYIITPTSNIIPSEENILKSKKGIIEDIIATNEDFNVIIMENVKNIATMAYLMNDLKIPTVTINESIMALFHFPRIPNSPLFLIRVREDGTTYKVNTSSKIEEG